jgi:hypothetical protein
MTMDTIRIIKFLTFPLMPDRNLGGLSWLGGLEKELIFALPRLLGS